MADNHIYLRDKISISQTSVNNVAIPARSIEFAKEWNFQYIWQEQNKIDGHDQKFPTKIIF